VVLLISCDNLLSFFLPGTGARVVTPGSWAGFSHCSLQLFEGLQDAGVQSRRQVRVVDGTGRHVLKHLLVLVHLLLLEPINGQVAVVDSDEVGEATVLLNVLAHLLNTALQLEQ
jgi:hypothetical protein